MRPTRWIRLERSFKIGELFALCTVQQAHVKNNQITELWVQYVSSTPATRLDVINLQEQLDQRLTNRQARETGICPVREELYAQCFDELIRQVRRCARADTGGPAGKTWFDKPCLLADC